MRQIKITDDLETYEVTEETCAKVKALIEADKKPYQFKAGDVVENEQGKKRVIVRDVSPHYVLKAFTLHGHFQTEGQKEFEAVPYKKIGVISDYIK